MYGSTVLKEGAAAAGGGGDYFAGGVQQWRAAGAGRSGVSRKKSLRSDEVPLVGRRSLGWAAGVCAVVFVGFWRSIGDNAFSARACACYAVLSTAVTSAAVWRWVDDDEEQDDEEDDVEEDVVVVVVQGLLCKGEGDASVNDGKGEDDALLGGSRKREQETCTLLLLRRAFDPVANLRSIFVRRNTTTTGALDGLRALAFVWVVAFHCRVYGLHGQRHPSRLAVMIVEQGAYGVSLFLALSGFLLALSLLREQERSPCAAYLNFIARRFGRIYPALLVGVFVTQVATARMHNEPWDSACEPESKRKIAGFVPIHLKSGLARLMTQATLSVWNFDPEIWHDHCWATAQPWTVSLEFQYYLMTPPLVFVYRWRKSAGVALALALYASSFWYRAYLSHETVLQQDAPDAPMSVLPAMGNGNVYTYPLPRLLEYLSGILACYLYLHEEKKRQIVYRVALLEALSLVANVTLVAVVWGTWWSVYFGQEVKVVGGPDGSSKSNMGFLEIWLGAPLFALSAATTMLLCTCDRYSPHLAVTTRSVKFLLRSKFWYPIAALSYTSYLTQGIAENVVKMYLSPKSKSASVSNNWYNFPVVLALSLGSGLVLSLTVERPCMRLSNTLLRPRPGPPPPPAATSRQKTTTAAS